MTHKNHAVSHIYLRTEIIYKVAMTVFIDPARTTPRLRPIKAMRHMKALLKDNEDTEQVFHIMEALNGNSLIRDLRRFTKEEDGRQRVAERLNLPEILDDHESLRKLPDGTVGRAYLNFMEREGLTAAGLVEESEKWWSGHDRFEDDVEYYAQRRRDIHDLTHVLTGYGRDQLGETSVLAFSYAQHGGFGSMFISFIGGRDLAKNSPREARIMDSIWEAKRNGKAARDIGFEHIPSLLAEPLDAARARLGINEPKAYLHALDVLHANGYTGQLSAA